MASVLHDVCLALPPVDCERRLKRRLANPATGSVPRSERSLDLCLPNRSKVPLRQGCMQFGRSLTHANVRFAPQKQPSPLGRSLAQTGPTRAFWMCGGSVPRDHLTGAAPFRRTSASFHSITSSARSKTDGGSVRPIACAACTLAMSWNLVCCRNGRSAGLAPANMSAI
jgi:hypothetical protein